MSKRPSTFVEWRKLYNANLSYIGGYVAWLAEHGKHGPNKEIHVDRHLHYLLERQRRLQIRMDVEHETRDDSYLREAWKMIFGRDITDMREEP